MDPDGHEPSRRRFLTGVAGGATLAAVGTVGAAAIGASTSGSRTGGGLVTYRGPANRDGPADRPLPAVPVAVDDDGSLLGRFPFDAEGTGAAERGALRLGGEQYSPDWFRYCDFKQFAGLRPQSAADTHADDADTGTDDADAVDSYLRHARDAPYDWQFGRGGERLTVQEFADYESWDNGVGTGGLGKPALATWRSTDDRSIPVIVVRSPLVSAPEDRWFGASTERSFVAWAAPCPLQCTVTTFKSIDGSEKFGAGDFVYCPRCMSTFRPFEHARGRFVAPAWE